MNWPYIITGRSPLTRNHLLRCALVALLGWAISQTLVAESSATEIILDNVATSAPATASESPSSNSSSAAADFQSDSPAKDELAFSHSQSDGDHSAALDEQALVDSPDDFDAADVDESDLNSWLPVTAEALATVIARFNAGSIQTDLTQAMGATRLTYETICNLPVSIEMEVESLAWLFDGQSARPRRIMLPDVTVAFSEITSPEPDIFFLLFLAVQSLWGLVSRPRSV
jgi:hypothetical protein